MNVRDLRVIYNKSSCKLKNKLSFFNQEKSSDHDKNVNIIIVTRKKLKNRKKQNVFIQAQQPRVASRLSRFSKYKKQGSITRHSSMPELNKCSKPNPLRNRSGHGRDTIQNKNKLSPFYSKFIVNVVSEHRFNERLNPFYYPRQTKLKIYRCEVGGAEDNCCCSCNSDAMFEIMRSLYECYKKRDCRDCKCILCSHLPKDKLKFSEKEIILRERALKGQPLPEGITPSDHRLINKVRTDLGVPVEPKTKEIRDKHEEAAIAGKLLPLEGKTPAEKEKILQDLFDLGIPLPKGRTRSEKALIYKIGGITPSDVISVALSPSEQQRRAKAEGLLTPLKGKTPEEKEKILKGLAMIGLPLPEGQSPSENKLIEKVRTDLGLPIEPTTKEIRDKHEKAAKAGKLLPLEGKTPAQKAKILKRLHNMEIPLPVGRTPSEKSLIAKIAASPRGSSKASSVLSATLSDKMRRAKAEGLMTTLKGKSAKQREKILKGLAMKGLPLPEPQSPSEKKIIKKVRTDLGVPVEPKTKAIRDKHEKAAKAGKLLPLEGKSPAKKEKILRGLHDMNIPLPVGRTPSEKSLIAKIAASPRSPSKASTAAFSPSEQMRQAKAEGLLTSLKGKSPEQKEKIIKGLAMKGLPLPEAQSPSEKKLIDKVRTDVGLPKDPTTKSMKEKYDQAAKAGLLQPLEGKTPKQKEKTLKGLLNLGIPLPEGRTPSEKALIEKVKTSPRVALSEKLRKAKAEGLLTPLKGKSPEEKEKIVKGLAMKGLPLPEPRSPSEQKVVDKVRADLGLPKDPTTKSMKEKHDQAAKAGLLEPLEGKTPAEKAKILKGLRDMGIPLPEGRTPSEKALIGKVKESPPSIVALSEKLRRAKAQGLLTPLKGKSPEEKEKIVKGLAMKGLPLPEPRSPSEQKVIDKVRADLGLPKDPTTKSMKEKHEQAAKAGLLEPLEGKTPAEKAKVLKGLRDMGIPLPEGRTPSEKALIEKVKASPPSLIAPSEQLRRAKAQGLLTPLKGKSPEEKEKIVKGLAMKGLLLPEAETPSEKKLIDKVRADLGLPKDPTTKSMKEKYEQAAKAGLLQPLEGKTPAEKAKVLKGLRDMGIPLPEGRTPSEKALIGKVKESPRSIVALSDKLRRAKQEGLLTPLKGKTPEEKEKIVKGLAMKGIPLPEGESPSEKKLIDKVRADLGLPKDPTTKSMKEKHEQAAKAGLLEPLEGKTPAEKAKVLKGLRDMGIPLPDGRTPSEKALIAKVKASPRSVIAPSELLRRAKAEGLLTPLQGKTPEQKEKILKGLAMKGLPLPEAQSPSEKGLIDKVRTDLGLPKNPTTKSMKEKHEQAAKAGLLQPLEGKTPAEKEKILKGFRDLGIPLPEGRTPTEKALIAKVKASPRTVIAPSEQLRRAKAEGLLTPLQGKSPEEKEKIIKGLAMKGLLLPEAKSPSERKLIDKVRADLGLPKDPTTKSMKDKHEKAAKAGLLEPLEGKTPAEKAKILKGLRDLGIPLPEGRTPTEKALIAKVKASPRTVIAPSEQLRRAKAEGLLTPLQGKSPEEKEKIIKGLAMKGLLLPEAKSPSERKLIDKVRADLGLPRDPTTKSMKDKHEKAAKAGLLQPLEGKTPAEKEDILKGLRDLGIPLPQGRTPSEKALIAKVKASPRTVIAPSEQLRRAKAEGLLTPLQGKSPEEKEKIIKGLAMKGLLLPEAKSPSERKLIDKVRADLGLPRDPTTKSMKDKHEKAAKAGLLQPLEGKTPAEKEDILKGLRDLGIPLPQGRTPSEKALIAKVKTSPPSSLAHSEQLRKAKADGLLTPLKGKKPEEKEKILKGLAMIGLPLPEGQSPSEKSLINKVRADLGLPIEPETKAIRDKHEKASKAGKLLPLEGKTPAQKENILKGLHNMGIPLPVGRTPSEKSLIAKIAASPRRPSKAASLRLSPSEQLRRAKAEGLLTSLQGKTPDEREKILKGLAMIGLPLPEGQSPSENKLIEKVRTDLGVPVEPKTKAIRDKHEEAAKAGKLLPLEGKTPAQKENILKGLHNMGIPLPVGRTPSEKSLIAKIAASPRGPSKASSLRLSPSEQLRRAKAEGLLTSLQGKTPDEREKILKGLAMIGLPLPEGQSPSENKLIEKVRTDLGVPVEPKTKAIRDKHEEAAKAGKLLPLEGKTPAQKEKILKGLHDMGIPLPIGRTPSEKALIAKVMEGPAAKKAAGIATEYEEIQKTTKCDRGCGCDKKKIRFKHSYVKIRVTSPDMASLCDCTDECLPGIKGGAFINNDGIQVTVGSAVGVPSITTEYYDRILIEKSSFLNSITRPNSTESDNIYQQSSTTSYQGRNSKSDRTVERCLQSFGASDQNDITSKTKSASSNGSILILKSEMSLHSTISNKTMDTVSLMSIMDSSISPSSTHYSRYQSTDDLRSSSLDESTSNDLTNHLATIAKSKKFWHIGAAKPKREYTVLRMSQTRLNFGNNEVRTNKQNSEKDHVVIINRLPSKLDVSKIMNKIMSKKRFAGASSIFVVVPMSEDEEEHSSSNCVDSMTSINSIESETILKDTSKVDPNPALTPSLFTKRNENICGKGRKFFMKEVSSNERETTCQNESVQVLQRIETANREVRQIRKLNEMPGMLEMAVRDVGTEVNTIKPCRCQPKIYSDPDVKENRSSVGHCTANVISRQKGTLSRQDRGTSCSRLPDMRTPSSVSLVQPRDKSGIVRSNQFPIDKSGRCHLADMRTLSEISLIQLRDSSSAMKSRILPSKSFGCSRLPDMRNSSTGSLDQACPAHTQPSVESSLFPHKNTGYYRLPNMSSTVSPILHCEASCSSDYDWPCLFLSGTFGCCYPRLMKTASTGSSEHLSDITMFSYSQVVLNNSWSHSAHLGYNRHKYYEPRRPSKQNRCKEIITPCSVPCLSSRKHKWPKYIENRSSLIQSDLFRAETITPRRNCPKPLSHTNKTKLRASTNKLRTEGPEQHPANRQSCMPKDSLEEEDCLSEDIISIRDLQIQTSIKSKMPIDSDHEEYCLYEDIENTNIITNEIPKQPLLALQSRRKSKMPTDSARKEYCLCEDIAQNTNIITNEISKQPLPLQSSRKSKMPTDSAHKEYCLCEDIESTYIISNEISKQPLPPLQSTRKSKMPTDSVREEYCLCEDIESTNIITNEIPKQPLPLQSSRKSKMLIDSAHEEYCLCEDIESTNNITNEIPNTNKQQSKKITDKDCACQQQAKDSAIKLTSECQHESKAFAIKVNCKCQNQSNKSANKENSEYQQSKNFLDNDFCAYEEGQARNRLCTTGQVQHQARPSPKHSQITKLISSIKKSISRKIDKTVASILGAVKKKSNIKLKTKKVSKKPQTHHSIQTIPEQISWLQQMPPDEPKGPEVIYDGYPYECNCGWIDKQELMRLRSELTATTSGFKVRKKRRRFRMDETICEKPQAEIELDFEDAIKYYVGKNLELFRDLIPQLESVQGNAIKEENKPEKTKKMGNDSLKKLDEKKNEEFVTSKDCNKRPYELVPPEKFSEITTPTPVSSAELAKLYPKRIKSSDTDLPAPDGPVAAEAPAYTGIAPLIKNH